MTTDERLDKLAGIVERLAERTDGLTHTAELLGAMQIETEKRLGKLIQTVEHVDEQMGRLIHIVLRHEERLDDLEGNQPRQ